ncbi:MAG: glycoside hydrolase family 1 protein [Candidatus Omnitrophica bacterium]|nr:glycoside hydrolase family 1 protein [Candidatus Omnitrophota bacterium]
MRCRYIGSFIFFLLVSMGAGCVSTNKKITASAPREFTFPQNFLWGAATSSHQVEGNNTNNDWWEWEQIRLPHARSGQACDQWNRYEEDFKLAQSLGHNAHRFSIEWSRIEPQEGIWDSTALDHYAQVIRSLKSKGLEPIVTLNHFTLPLWLAHQGGWNSEKAPELFAGYVEKVVEVLGADVHYWMTLNEPVVYAYKGYMSADWPPGMRSSKDAINVFENLLRGHVMAYEKIKDIYVKKGWKTPLVGIAQSVIIFRACLDTTLRDRIAARFRHWMFNHLFVQALVRGHAYCIGLFNIHLSQAKTLDFIGLNYYTRDFVLHNGFGFPGILGQECMITAAQNRHTGKDNFLSWDIYPKGLCTLLKDFSRYKLPILISENGLATNDDFERSGFIIAHIKAVAQAMKEGVPVIGYLYWSLLDNYEWAEGFVPRFGLIAVDYKTQERTVRESAIKFKEIIQTKKIYF